MGHFILHAGIGVLMFEDEAMTEGCIETEMGFMGEPDKVGGSIVGVVAIHMMTLMIEATRTDPSDSDKKMTIRIADEVAHPRIVGMHVGFGFEVLRHVGLVRVQTSGRKRVEHPGL